MLPLETFKTVVEFAPLFSMDVVVINEHDELLFGKRLNAPAKDWWFVPGGRVFKNETLACAFERITADELGKQFTIKQAKFLGLYEHFYNDCMFDDAVSTHYINVAYVVKVKLSGLQLPQGEQHLNYRWLPRFKVHEDLTIHQYSKVFMEELVEYEKEI